MYVWAEVGVIGNSRGAAKADMTGKWGSEKLPDRHSVESAKIRTRGVASVPPLRLDTLRLVGHPCF